MLIDLAIDQVYTPCTEYVDTSMLSATVSGKRVAAPSKPRVRKLRSASA